MSRSRALDRQFDLFVPFVADIPLRDQRETMERPFFSLSKNKRLKPIHYTSPDGSVFVKITANPEYGMASIWDADILIWAASVICDMKKHGRNDIPQTLHFQPYDLLKTIHRDTGGREYKLLKEALGRLQATTIETNIRADRRKNKERQFSWIHELTDVTNENGESLGMSFTLSNWFYEGVLSEGGVLAIDPEYFRIKGGRERWLYRVARKHAGGAGEEGFAISLPTLYEKSGAEGSYRRFKFEMLKVAREDELPSFALRIEQKGQGEPVLRMVRREFAPPPGEAVVQTRRKPISHKKTASTKAESIAALPLFSRQLTEETIARIRRDFPGWDIYALQAEFNEWIDEDRTRSPKNYGAAFYGFVKRHTAQN